MGVLQNDRYVQSCTKLTLPKTSRKPARSITPEEFHCSVINLGSNTLDDTGPYDAKCLKSKTCNPTVENSNSQEKFFGDHIITLDGISNLSISND